MHRRAFGTHDLHQLERTTSSKHVSATKAMRHAYGHPVVFAVLAVHHAKISLSTAVSSTIAASRRHPRYGSSNLVRANHFLLEYAAKMSQACVRFAVSPHLATRRAHC